jgi:hypothetical protein
MKCFAILPIALFALLSCVNPTAAATLFQDLYYDTFTDSNGTDLAGRPVEVNNGPVGTVYQEHNGFWPATVEGSMASVGADTGASLNVKGNGFVPSSILRISGQLDVNTVAGPTTPSNTGDQRGVGIGYWTGIGSVATNGGWRGVELGTDGRLILSQHGVAGASRAGFIAELATGVNTAVPHQLSYDINLISGDISNIVFDGSAIADVSTAIFTSANIGQAGLMVSSAAGGTFGLFDNLTVQTKGMQVPGIYGTGVDDNGIVLAPGTSDPHWTITSVPGASSFVTPGAAVVQSNHPAWIANDPVGTAGSSFISVVPAGTTGIPGGQYTYETTFDLTGFDEKTFELAMRITADDSAEVFLNGNATGITHSGFGSFSDVFYLTDGFQAGLNNLSIVLTNGGDNPGGLRVELTGFGQVPEPASMLVWGLMGAAFAGYTWRKRKAAK